MRKFRINLSNEESKALKDHLENLEGETYEEFALNLAAALEDELKRRKPMAIQTYLEDYISTKSLIEGCPLLHPQPCPC